MALSSLSKKKLRFCLSSFFESSQSFFKLPSLPRTLASTEPYSFQNLDLKRFGTPFTSSPSFSLIFSSGSLAFCSLTRRFPQALHFHGCTGNGAIRWFSLSSLDVSPGDKLCADGSRSVVTAKQVSEIIESILSGENEFESKVNTPEEKLSRSSIMEILQVLNSARISALPFFNWIRRCQPEFCWCSDICSLVIDNCSRLGDLETMYCLLNDLSRNNVKLTRKAFRFLPVVNSTEAKNCVREVVELLNEVGGSCLVSGIPALIKMFGELGSFELAKYVLRNTQEKHADYNVLIRIMCQRCDFDGVIDMLDEMRRMSFAPNVKMYNYILSNLCKHNKFAESCKLIQEMQERDCAPNALTFEILIYHLCKLGKLDLANKLLDRMKLRGIEPRLTMHNAFIKCYFNLGDYDAAYNYVVSSSDKHKCPSNRTYSLLSRLHRRKGNLVTAHDVLSGMMKKGFRPDFGEYRGLLKRLRESRKEDLVKSLENSFCSLSLQSTTNMDCR